VLRPAPRGRGCAPGVLVGVPFAAGTPGVPRHSGDFRVPGSARTIETPDSIEQELDRYSSTENELE